MQADSTQAALEQAQLRPSINWGDLAESFEVQDTDGGTVLDVRQELLESLEGIFEHCALVHIRWGDHCNQREADAAIARGRAAIARGRQVIRRTS